MLKIHKKVIYMINKVIHGDCLDVLKELDDNSVDSVVTDPPYGLSKEPDINEVLSKWLAGEEYDHGHGGFMGKSWDSFVPHPDIWREVYRVLKPGGHALVFAGTRTQDLMTISLRLAGFEVRDVIEWLYFSGFPKSHDVSKAFDRRAGAEREVVGYSERPSGLHRGSIADFSPNNPDNIAPPITTPATDLARKWDGWGTSLKPSHEPIIVVRKPLIDADTGRKLTVADCVEKYGTGAINIDATRIDGAARTTHKDGNQYAKKDTTFGGWGTMDNRLELWNKVPEKRFPANCITLDSDEFYSKYFNVGQANISPEELSKKASKKDRNSDWRGEEIALEEAPTGHENLQNSNGFERFNTINRNNHPTVKPTDLMAWLVRLVTPAGGTVLDPFAGSGSTLVAAKREGFGFIGVELTEEYIPIIEARVGVEHIAHIKADEKETDI